MVESMKTSAHLKASFGTVNEVTKTEVVEVPVEVPVGGTTDYNELINKPKVNTVELKGNKSFEDLGLNRMSNSDLESLFNSVFD